MGGFGGRGGGGEEEEDSGVECRGCVLEERIPNRPSHASQLSLLRVWMLARLKPAMAATATKTAVQVPCTESELRPMEMPSMPEPATQVQTVLDALAGVWEGPQEGETHTVQR